MRKIMIIDDDNEFLEEISEVLIKCGYDVSIISDSTQALSKTLKSKPDTILLDLKMKKLDGFEIANNFKKEYQKQNIFVL